MGVKRIEDLVAFQFAEEFKGEVFRLLRESANARWDYRFRNQLGDAASGVASNITEGFHRYSPAQAIQFLRYALATLAEAKERVRDGIARGYFNEADAATALRWADRCRSATQGYRASQQRLLDEKTRDARQRALEKRRTSAERDDDS